jgi:hypothetical protein
LHPLHQTFNGLMKNVASSLEVASRSEGVQTYAHYNVRRHRRRKIEARSSFASGC